MEQLPDIYTNSGSDVLEPGNRGSIYPTLHQPNEVHRVVGLFLKLFLSQAGFAPKVNNVPAKQSMKVSHTKSVKELPAN